MAKRWFSVCVCVCVCSFAVADLGFPRKGEYEAEGRDTDLLYGKIFANNYMKMKEFGQRALASPLSILPLDCTSSLENYRVI